MAMTPDPPSFHQVAAKRLQKQQYSSSTRRPSLQLTKDAVTSFDAKGLPGLGGSPQWSTTPGFRDKVFSGSIQGAQRKGKPAPSSLQGTSRAPRY